MGKKRYDWEPIEKEYAAGQLSEGDLSRKHGPSRTAISKHMKKAGIIYGSLASNVRLKIAAKLVADEVAGQVASEEAIEAAATTGATVIKSHRNDIRQLQVAEEKLLAELFDNPTKLYITQHQGEIIEKEVDLTVTERLTGLSNLANVRAKRIVLERQAFALDDPSREKPSSKESLLDILLDKCDQGGLPRK